MKPASLGSDPVVTVRGTRRNAFVDFEFALDDGILAVELVLPLAAFDELCASYAIVPRCANEEAALALLDLRRRHDAKVRAGLTTPHAP